MNKIQINHILKTDPGVFELSATGKKGYEIRFNDRCFAVGDVLLLRETVKSGDDMRSGGADLEFTGRELHREVTAIVEGYGLAEGWVILSVKDQLERDNAELKLENERLKKETCVLIYTLNGVVDERDKLAESLPKIKADAVREFKRDSLTRCGLSGASVQLAKGVDVHRTWIDFCDIYASQLEGDKDVN